MGQTSVINERGLFSRNTARNNNNNKLSCLTINDRARVREYRMSLQNDFTKCNNFSSVYYFLNLFRFKLILYHIQYYVTMKMY